MLELGDAPVRFERHRQHAGIDRRQFGLPLAQLREVIAAGQSAEPAEKDEQRRPAPPDCGADLALILVVERQVMQVDVHWLGSASASGDS